MNRFRKISLTVAIIGIAIFLVAFKYLDYVRNPWTRNGQVRANVIQVATRVTGPIVDLPIVDNQAVKAGDLLFRIDPRTYQAQYDEAAANYDNVVQELAGLDSQIAANRAVVTQSIEQIAQSRTQVASAAADLAQAGREYQRYQELVGTSAVSQSTYDTQRRNYLVAVASNDQAKAALAQAKGALSEAQAQLAAALAKRGSVGSDNAQLRAAKAALEGARLNLEFTEQRAPVDGYITNLNVQLGSTTNANQPALALVDSSTFWIDAYFRETMLENIKSGDPAYVTLMAYPDIVIPAHVDSIGWGISQQDGSSGTNLLAVVQPSFEWIRLAQRIPVKIKIGKLPKGVLLRVGTTASILVSEKNGSKAPPAPRALQ